MHWCFDCMPVCVEVSDLEVTDSFELPCWVLEFETGCSGRTVRVDNLWTVPPAGRWRVLTSLLLTKWYRQGLIPSAHPENSELYPASSKCPQDLVHPPPPTPLQPSLTHRHHRNTQGVESSFSHPAGPHPSDSSTPFCRELPRPAMMFFFANPWPSTLCLSHQHP